LGRKRKGNVCSFGPKRIGGKAMDEYSSLGSGIVNLPPADRVLKVSPKKGSGERKGRKKQEAKKSDDRLSVKDLSVKGIKKSPEALDNEEEGKGLGVDIII